MEENHGHRADEEHEKDRSVLRPGAAGHVPEFPPSQAAAEVFKDLFKNTIKADTSWLDVERGEATADGGDAAF